MSEIILTAGTTENPYGPFSYAAFGKSKTVHLSARNDETLCGRFSSTFRYVANGDVPADARVCTPCDRAAVKRAEDRARLEYATRAAETQDDVMHAAGTRVTTPRGTGVVVGTYEGPDADVIVFTPDAGGPDVHTLAATAAPEETAEETADAPYNMLALTDAERAVLETNRGRLDEMLTASLRACAASMAHTDRYFVTGDTGKLTMRQDVDPAAYSSAVINANDTAREETFRPLSARWFAVLDSTYDMITDEQGGADSITRRAQRAAATHVIGFTWSAVTECGYAVKAPCGILRVSVDPTDATCAECRELESVRAELDARVPDEEAMFSAYVEAVQNGGVEAAAPLLAPDAPVILTAAQTAAYDAHMIAPQNRRADGRVTIPGLGGVTAELPPVVSVEREGRFLVASVASLGLTVRVVNGPHARRSVEFWAKSNGVRPASGKRWEWIKSGDALVAPGVLL
jgi:hypothetical protein